LSGKLQKGFYSIIENTCLIFSHSDIKLKLKFGKYPEWKEVGVVFKKIKPLWDERKSFEDFLRNALSL